MVLYTSHLAGDCSVFAILKAFSFSLIFDFVCVSIHGRWVQESLIFVGVEDFIAVKMMFLNENQLLSISLFSAVSRKVRASFSMRLEA